MAKNMARIEDGTVTNLEWCSDDVPETAELREYDGYSICIGDSYADGKWWRDGEEVLSDAEIAAQVAAEEAARATDGYICIPSYCIPSYAPGAGGEKATPQPSGGSGGSNRTACQTYTRAHPDGQMDGCGWSAGGSGDKGV